MKLVIHLCDSKRKKHKIRPVFRLGKFIESHGPVAPSGYSCKRPTKGTLIMAFEMSSAQQVTVTVEFRDKKGNKAKVDGMPEWATDNSEVLTLTPAADGLSCVVAAAGPLSTANITLTADADLGTGVKPVIGTLEVTITAGEAATVVLTPGTPSDQP